MQITVNGKTKELSSEVTILQLLDELNMKPQIVNVQLNENVIDQDTFSEQIVRNGDVVEILMFMGGGQR